MTIAGTTSTGFSAAAPLLVNGLVSGINTQAVIQALLQSYSVPITNLESQQQDLKSQASDYQALNADMQALLSAADALNTPGSWNLAQASSSDSTVATATAAPGAQSGSLSFNVDQLAQGNVLASTAGVSSTGTVVTNAPSLLVATGAPALGFIALGAGSGLSLGAHSLQVTQSSAAASVRGTALSSSTAITTGTNDTLDLSVNGTGYALTLQASSGESPSALVAAVNAAAQAAGAPVTATLSASGALQLSTTEQGSAASLSVSGGDALASLGLSAGQSGTGIDAVVSVDGTSTTLSALNPGATLTLAAPSGSIAATLASAPGPSGALVSTGSASAGLVSTGTGTLSAVVAAINASGLGVSASAVQAANGTDLLQVGASKTGLSGAVTLDPAAFAGGALGGLQTITAAQDALVSVGGASGDQVSSATDTFTGLLSGTAITVAATGQATVSVSPDAAGEAALVNKLVSAANKALGDIQTYAGYNATTKTGGPLMGSAVIEGLRQSILAIFASATGSSGLGGSSAAGITVASDGTIQFNQATFAQAYANDPAGVSSLFAEGGTFTPASGFTSSQVSLVYAGTKSVPGSYAVTVSHSATQATDTGAVLSSGTTSAAEQLSITQGAAATTYAVSAGESLSAVAAGLNAAFASAGMTLTANVVASGTQLQVTSEADGSAQSFTVSSSAPGAGTTGLGGATANTPVTYAGTDVAGTINGVSATGAGQVLTAPASDPTLQGLSLLVSASGITTPTTVGTYTYSPGIAQQLASVADAASNLQSGSLVDAINGLQQEATGLNGQIANYQQMESEQQTLLQNEFAKMEATLGQLKNEGAQFSSAVAGLPGF